MEGMRTIYRQCLVYLFLQRTVVSKILNGNNIAIAKFIFLIQFSNYAFVIIQGIKLCSNFFKCYSKLAEKLRETFRTIAVTEEEYN